MVKKLNLRITFPVFLFLSIQVIPLIICAQERHDFVITSGGGQPSMACDSLGRIYVVWHNTDGVYMRVFDSVGTALVPSKTLGLSEGDFTGIPRFALTPKAAMVGWHVVSQFPEVFISLRSIEIGGDSILGAIKTFRTFAQGFAPDFISLDDTTFFTLWVSELGGVVGKQVTKSDAKEGATKQVLGWHGSGQLYGIPRIATNRESDRMVVCILAGLDTGNSVCLKTLFKTGDPTDTLTVMFGKDEYAFVWSPCAAMLPNGDFLLVWSGGSTVETGKVYLRKYDKQAAPIGNIQIVSDVICGYYPEARIAMDSDGKYIVVWESKATGRWRIMGQRYLADGSRFGLNFMISSASDAVDHFLPGVSLQDGRVCIIWDAGPQILGVTAGFDKLTNVVSADEIIEPKSFALSQNYPNPFNPSTTITFDLPGFAFVSLKVYDVLGREVARLVNETKTPGGHSVKWDASDFPSGIYFARLEAAGRLLTRKMCLVK
jgi:hypothetical protein